ncbi:hypothetical protein N7540_009458 [Penicillium herquei]|nr:hypothetical protein N7540_009458 [Penicillium herquei]
MNFQALIDYDPDVKLNIAESVSPFIRSQPSVTSEPHNDDGDATALPQPILSVVPADPSAFPGPYVPAGFHHTSQNAMNYSFQLGFQQGLQRGSRDGFRRGFQRGFQHRAQDSSIQRGVPDDAQTDPLPSLPPVSQPGIQPGVESSSEVTPNSIATRLAGIENLSPEAQTQLVASISNDIHTSIVSVCRHLTDGTLNHSQTEPFDRMIKAVKGKDRKLRKQLERENRERKRRYRPLVGNLADITAMHRKRLGQMKQMRGKIDDLVREGEIMTDELREVRERLYSATSRHLRLASQTQSEDSSDLVPQGSSESSMSSNEEPSEDQTDSSSSSDDASGDHANPK